MHLVKKSMLSQGLDTKPCAGLIRFVSSTHTKKTNNKQSQETYRNTVKGHSNITL